MILSKRIVSAVLLALMLTMATVSVFVMNGVAWSNGGYSVNPDNPDYGTHDWIAQHALDWLPDKEKMYILDNLAAYLYGTELPDNGQASDGIGDIGLHHVYFDQSGGLIDDSAAVRAETEFTNTLNILGAKDFKNASKFAGIMTHYIADLVVFAHVMGASTDWGKAKHHDDFENGANGYTSSYNSTFTRFLVFDGSLIEISAFDAAVNLAYDTTFDKLTYTAVWMDQNYNWNNQTFVDRVGESLNLAVNYITDVLHTLYLKSEATAQPPFEPPSNPPSNLPTLPPVTIPMWIIGAAIAVIALIIVLAVSRSQPRQPRGKLVRFL